VHARELGGDVQRGAAPAAAHVQHAQAAGQDTQCAEQEVSRRAESDVATVTEGERSRRREERRGRDHPTPLPCHIRNSRCRLRTIPYRQREKKKEPYCVAPKIICPGELTACW
jgi:hypothetical protein